MSAAIEEQAIEAAQRHFDASPTLPPSHTPSQTAYAPLTLPHSNEAEREVLSAVFVSPGPAMDTIGEHLTAGDFYQPANALLYASMLKLHEGNAALDLVTLRQELKDSLSFERIGGDAFLAGLMDRAGHMSGLASYCETVKHKALLRRMIDAARAIEADGLTPGQTAAECMEAAEARMLEAMEARNGASLRSILDLVPEAMEQLRIASEHEGKVTGLPSGFRDLDERTNGLHGGDLIILAARPAMGKTSFALNIASSAALYGASVAVFSLEMPEGQLTQRLLAAEARVNMAHMRSGDLDANDWVRVTAAADDLRPTSIHIDDTPGVSVSTIRAACRRLKRGSSGLDLIVVDYLQLMTGPGKSREQEISGISRALKGLAKELDCPVICLSQLNRSCESRTDKRPMLSDLRESGAIEQDADIVLFLYRHEVYQNPPLAESQGAAECIIGKHRNGPTGTVKLRFEKQFTRFANTEWRDEL